MLLFLSRLARALPILIALALVSPAQARNPAAVKAPSGPWLYRGSDIPPDTAWTFGELPNGLRYAVRRNGVPPHQVSIRVAIDAGSLMETDAQRGYAHFIEHLSYRGSKFVADGEAKRVWQRLGATFGADTNAETSPTQTIYKLDLPNATPEGLDESVHILSGMMAGPLILPSAVETERRTVLAELREGASPQRRGYDATRELFFAHQAMGTHSSIGDPASLNAATAAGLHTFHDRWYRPSRALVVIVGDEDPAILAALVQKHFGAWKAVGPNPPEPDFGKPDASAPQTRVLIEPGLPTTIALGVLRPWSFKNDTVEYNRRKQVDVIAARLISRRLESRARAGASYLDAQISQEDEARSADGTFIQIVPAGPDWAGALRDVRSVIADVLANPPLQEDIDREARDYNTALTIGVETAGAQSAADLADTMVEAVNIRETVASPEVQRDVFSHMEGRLTPASIQAATLKLMTGTPLRASMTLPAAQPGAEAKLLATLTAPVPPPPPAAPRRAVSFDRIPHFGPAGSVASRVAIPGLDISIVTLSNGVRLVLFANQAEPGKIEISARFGHGRLALPTDRKTVAWAGQRALVESGVADFDQDELDRLTSGRRINMDFDIDDDAFILKAVTRAADYADQMKLLAAKLAFPRWAAPPVNRAKAALAVTFDTASASPDGVIDRDLDGLLHGGDPRWATPGKDDLAALTPSSFRALWEPLLKSGPIEVSIYGDIDPQAAIDAALSTFGALPSRIDAPVPPAAVTPPAPKPTTTPLILTHNGPADQAAAVLAWPTAGGISEIYESRKLEVLAQIFGDRMFDKLREAEGASYSPSAQSSWPTALNSGGSIVVASQLRPEKADQFFTIAKDIAADLVTQPVTADEFDRAIGPMRQQILRASSGNHFWLQQLSGVSFDRRKLIAVATLQRDFARMTPAELQESAARWLKPETAFSIKVVPK